MPAAPSSCARPSLVPRLVVAPREHIQSVGAFLRLALSVPKTDTEIAPLSDNGDPRDLLRAALPGCPPRLYRALGRAGDRVRERRFYEGLSAAALGPFADALLDGGALDERRTAHYEALLRTRSASAGTALAHHTVGPWGETWGWARSTVEYQGVYRALGRLWRVWWRSAAGPGGAGGGAHTNRFWSEAATGTVLRGEQWVGPNLPLMTVEFLPPAAEELPAVAGAARP